MAGSGPSPVGVRSLDVVDPARPDVLWGVGRDRHLKVEPWYPARRAGGCFYDSLLRDGVTPVRCFRSAGREAEAAAGDFPLVVLSHGFPGNRLLLGHFGEAIAIWGYRVASIDHAESTYGEAVYREGCAFRSTLAHRASDTAR